MPEPNQPQRTQKQIAQKYKDNLDYYKHGHFFRRFRLICFLLAVFGSLGAVFGFRYWGRPTYFNTGPISENHARFQDHCEACHDNVKPDPASALKLEELIENLKTLPDAKAVEAASRMKIPSAEEMRAKAAATQKASKEKLKLILQKARSSSSLSQMDTACLRCHPASRLHQPQSQEIALQKVSDHLSLVHANRCSECHREHIGHAPMKLPDSLTCATCHSSEQELQRTLQIISLDKSNVPVKAENRDLGDGVIRFLMPPDPKYKPVAFKSYAEGHPPFQYERSGARDPAVIKYNHQRHEQADIPDLDGRKMDCTYCHKPAAGGVYYQPVSYEQYCSKCHSLHIDPDAPGLSIPHGDPEKVRSFLRSLPNQYVDYFVNQKGVTDRVQLGNLVKEAFDRIKARGMTTGEELEQRVFFTGDPPREVERISPKTNKGTFFPACTKCHELTGGDANSAPKVTPTNMANRWVHHGPFTHLTHQHMSCVDCHGAARESKLTTDVLMPSQKLCAECHRPLAKSTQSSNEGKMPMPGSSEMAAKQRKDGGVKWDCESCHGFHAPPEALFFLQAEK